MKSLVLTLATKDGTREIVFGPRSSLGLPYGGEGQRGVASLLRARPTV